MFLSRSPDALIRVYDAVGNVIETHEHKAISKGGERYRAKKSRHAVKHGGSLLRSVDQI